MSVTHRKSINKGETFVVNIKCRQNHTWQGTVKRIDGQRELPFRSALELVKMIDSALELSEEQCEDLEKQVTLEE